MCFDFKNLYMPHSVINILVSIFCIFGSNSLFSTIPCISCHRPPGSISLSIDQLPSVGLSCLLASYRPHTISWSV